MIDTHAHLHSKAFAKDRDEVLQRVWKSGGRYLIEVNIGVTGWPLVQEMATLDPRIYITAGVHPHDTSRVSIEQLEDIFGSLDEPKVCAIGETGLDFFRDYAPRDLQVDFFRRHVAAARETGLPLVVHSRAAHEETLSILKEEGRGSVRGVFHCFSGDKGIADRAHGFGFLLGLGGAVTYNPRRAGQLVRAIGLDRIVLETDCPYLTPVPYRGRRNEPAYVQYVAEEIAHIKGLQIEDVARQSLENTISLFTITA